MSNIDKAIKALDNFKFKLSTMKENKIVYIAHPVGGDVENNLKRIEGIVSNILIKLEDVIPVAPYHLYCHSLDDNVPYERALGISVGVRYLKSEIVDELWLFGNEISSGMKDEILLCELLGIPVIPRTNGTADAYEDYKKQTEEKPIDDNIIYSIEDEDECRLIIDALEFVATKKSNEFITLNEVLGKEHLQHILDSVNEHDKLSFYLKEKLNG